MHASENLDLSRLLFQTTLSSSCRSSDCCELQTYNRCFSILLSGCETGQRFRCYVVATPSAAEHKHSTGAVCKSNCDHVVLARFSVWSSIFDFFWCWEDQDALSRPLFCFSLNNCKKKERKEKRFVPRPWFFPASRKTTPSSVAGCLVSISGSTVVYSDRVTLWLSTVEFCRGRDREVFMAVILAGERAVCGKKPRLRGCSVFAIKQKQVVPASPVCLFVCFIFI